MTLLTFRWSLAWTVLIVTAWSAPSLAVPVVFQVGGSNQTSSVQATVDAFRTDLGSPNNGHAAGPLNSGRREINWDGGGAATTVSPNPFNGFQNIRGALLESPTATGFVQAPPSGLATQFGNASYGTIFGTFSLQRLFTPIGSNITDVTFFIPGTNGALPATVTAFGAVFTDVDLGNSSHLEFFGLQGNSLGVFDVPAGTTADASLSFLGVDFGAERIARVRITSGNTALSATATDGGGVDVVAMDDFLYSEPRAVPEPAGLTLLGVGALALGFALRGRKRQV
jgi:hypothetical protein